MTTVKTRTATKAAVSSSPITNNTAGVAGRSHLLSRNFWLQLDLFIHGNRAIAAPCAFERGRGNGAGVVTPKE